MSPLLLAASAAAVPTGGLAPPLAPGAPLEPGAPALPDECALPIRSPMLRCADASDACWEAARRSGTLSEAAAEGCVCGGARCGATADARLPPYSARPADCRSGLGAVLAPLYTPAGMSPAGPLATGRRASTCAVVGSGASLSGARLGGEVDGHEVVMRLNRAGEYWDDGADAAARANRTRDVGARVDVMLASHNVLTECLLFVGRRAAGAVEAPWDSCWPAARTARAVLIASLHGARQARTLYGASAAAGEAEVSAEQFAASVSTAAAERAFDRPMLTYRSPRSWARHARRLLATASSEVGLPLALSGSVDAAGSVREPSSGFLLFLLSLQLCERVSLFGFGPDPSDAQRRGVADVGKGYSLSRRSGGGFYADHDFVAEHRLMRAWASGGRALLGRLGLPEAYRSGAAADGYLRRSARAPRFARNESRVRALLGGEAGGDEAARRLFARALCAEVRFVSGHEVKGTLS